MTDSVRDMEIYLVGGAVRDELLGLPVVERDWVVVGADEKAMRGRGFIPADRDFPVFLHPDTGEEYALARREHKHGDGYRGFGVYAGPDVTLEQDLRRRDLTVNAMARDGGGNIIDPYGGREDLEAGLLRHVSEAFVEDPLRVLRIARFAARLGAQGFRVAHATHRLMCRMVADGEMAHLRAERLWREMTRAMQTGRPWRFFEVLHRCGALQTLIPLLATGMGEPKAHGEGEDSPPIAALKRVCMTGHDVPRRLAATLLACVDSTGMVDKLAEGLRADRDTTRLLRQAVAAQPWCEPAAQGDAGALYQIAKVWRGFDSEADIEAPLAVCEAQFERPCIGRLLQQALPAARAVSAAALRDRGWLGAELGRRLAAARREAMEAALRAGGLST
ncbi:MAG: multifunctional CCA tRNA nucleotidyl transferase/2'3'-cyclic phosphodiesterase/2'nucleotidase/phosphatase [Sedimenticolaceae bacterium]